MKKYEYKCFKCGKTPSLAEITDSESTSGIKYSLQCCKEVGATSYHDSKEEAIAEWATIAQAPQPKSSMPEKDLREVIKLIKKQSEVNLKLYKMGIDSTELNDRLYRAIDILMEGQFGKANNEVLSWYIYENPKPPHLYEKDTNKVSYDLDKKGDLERFLNDK